MTIHLIKSAELSAEVFTAVYDLLTAVDGTITIKCDPASVINFDQEEIFKRFYEASDMMEQLSFIRRIGECCLEKLSTEKYTNFIPYHLIITKFL
jgi:hypothetical protein